MICFSISLAIIAFVLFGSNHQRKAVGMEEEKRSVPNTVHQIAPAGDDKYFKKLQECSEKMKLLAERHDNLKNIQEELKKLSIYYELDAVLKEKLPPILSFQDANKKEQSSSHPRKTLLYTVIKRIQDLFSRLKSHVQD